MGNFLNEQNKNILCIAVIIIAIIVCIVHKNFNYVQSENLDYVYKTKIHKQSKDKVNDGVIVKVTFGDLYLSISNNPKLNNYKSQIQQIIKQNFELKDFLLDSNEVVYDIAVTKNGKFKRIALKGYSNYDNTFLNEAMGAINKSMPFPHFPEINFEPDIISMRCFIRYNMVN